MKRQTMVDDYDIPKSLLTRVKEALLYPVAHCITYLPKFDS